MGLYMYLTGNKYFWTNWKDSSKNPHEDGFKVKSHNLELGYWCKHPNLHGYIVNTFAEGKDECQEIGLNEEDMAKIIESIKAKTLPATEDFFFGASESNDEQIAEDVAIFEAAIDWVRSGDDAKESRSVNYRASW